MGIVESQEISAKKKAKKSKKASLEEETKSSTTNRKSLIGMISVSEETQTSTKCHKSQIAKYKYLKNRRVERYRLQSIARKIFIGEGERNKLRFAQDFHRTAKCLVIRLNGIGNVGVHRSKQHGKAFYSGLIQCGSIWSCPVCASKIQEKRRIEVCNAIQWAYKNGYKCLLVTLTFPHYAWQECDALLRDQAKALEIFREGRVWQLLKKKIGFLGLIRSLEVTYGKNGWHPHTHEIWIVDGNCDAMSLLDFVKQRWFDACMKVGLIPDDKTKAAKVRGVDLIDNASTSDYLAKQNNNERMIEEQNKQIAEVWAMFKATDAKFNATDAKIEKLIDNWGRFVECFLAPGIPRAFQERNIDIIGTSERQKRRVDGETMEVDIMGVNTDCLVVVEVKTKLRPEYVQAFLKKLPNFKKFFPEYKDRIVYGAVAGISIIQEADVFAEKNGLWVITQSGDTVVIQNKADFKASKW